MDGSAATRKAARISGIIILLPDFQMTTNILGGKHPRCMTLVPLQITARQPAARPIQDEVFSKRQFQFLDAEPHRGAGKGSEVLSSEVLKAPCGQMPHMGGIGVGVMGAEMRRHHENIRARAPHAEDLRHRSCYVADMLD